MQPQQEIGEVLILGAGEAKLTGSDLRFLYYIDENLSYGLRLASHEGEDTTGLYSGYAYKISISETSPFVKYSHPFNEGGDSVIEGFFIASKSLINFSN